VNENYIQVYKERRMKTQDKEQDKKRE